MKRYWHMNPLWFLSVVFLTTLLLLTWWIALPPDRSKDLQPGTAEYLYYHGGQYDTIPADSLKYWNEVGRIGDSVNRAKNINFK